MLTQLIKAAGNLVGRGDDNGNGTSAKPTDPFESRVQSFANQRWTDLKSAYITYHQVVWDALLKYSGVLWIQWNNSTKTYDIVQSDDEWTPTPEINRFSPAIDSMISNFNSIPEVEAVPADVSDMTIYPVADIATKLAQWVSKTNALHNDFKGDEDKPGRAGTLLTLCGSVFTHVYPHEEQVGEKPEMATMPGVGVRCPQCDSYDTMPQEQAATIPPEQLGQCPQCGYPTEVSQTTINQPTGNMLPVIRHSVCIDIGNPLYMLPRPGAKHMGKGPSGLGYCMWAERMPTDYVFSRWGHEATPDQEYLDGYSTSYENTLQYYYTGAASSTVRTKEECMVVQLFIEPNVLRNIPEGAYAVMVNNQWFYVKQWAEEFDCHPISKCNYKNQPLLFFGRTDAFDLAKLQKESNHYEAVIKLHAMTSSMDPILQDENTQVDEITNRGDRVIKYRSLGPGSQPPTRLQHGTLDQGVYGQRDKIQSEFQNISGAVNVWKGEAPGSVTAASAISQLRGQAEQMFNTPEDNWRGLWVETVRKAVYTLQQRMESWEIAEIVGKGKDTEIDMFKRANLDNALNFVSSKNGLPKTKDERRQEMLTLFDHGALDTNDVNVKQQLVDLFGETGMLQQFNKDSSRARMENEQIKEGKLANPVVMVGIEDMAVHFAIHAEAIKSLDFDKWDPAVKQVMINHCLDTKECMMLEQSGVPDSTIQEQEVAKNQAGASGGGGGQAGAAGPAAGAGAAQAGSKNGRPGQPRRKAPGPNRGKVGAANGAQPNVPTGPNGPGAGAIPGGNAPV